MKKLVGWLVGLGMLGGSAQADPPSTQCVTNAMAGGTGNDIVVPLLPCALNTNLLILTLSATNTSSAVTLSMPGFPALPILNGEGGLLTVGQFKAGALVLLTGTGTSWKLLTNTSGTQGPPGVPGISLGRLSKVLGDQHSNNFYATGGTTTYSSGTYSAPVGLQPLPDTLVAGQVFSVKFNQANPGGANIRIGGLPSVVIKVTNGAGLQALKGGEIVAGLQTLLCYDGTEMNLECRSGFQTIPGTGAIGLTAGNFVNGDLVYNRSGGNTYTLPCAAKVSGNGVLTLFSTSGTITLARDGTNCAGDTIVRNGGSGTSVSIAAGDAPVLVVSDGVSVFYVSGS